MRRFLAVAFLSSLTVSLVGGCGVYNWLLGGNTETGAAKLIPFSSEQELADYLSGEIQRRNTSVFGFDRTTGPTDDGAFLEDAAPPAAGPVSVCSRMT